MGTEKNVAAEVMFVVLFDAELLVLPILGLSILGYLPLFQ